MVIRTLLTEEDGEIPYGDDDDDGGYDR